MEDLFVHAFGLKGNPKNLQGRVTAVSVVDSSQNPFVSQPQRKILGSYLTFNPGYYVEKFEPIPSEVEEVISRKRKLISGSSNPVQVFSTYRKNYVLEEQEVGLLPEDIISAGTFNSTEKAWETTVIALNTYLQMYFTQQEEKNAKTLGKVVDFENRSIRRYVLDTFVRPYRDVCAEPISVQSSNRALGLELGLVYFVKESPIVSSAQDMMNSIYLSGGRISGDLVTAHLDLVDSIHQMRFEESARLRDRILRLQGKPAFVR